MRPRVSMHALFVAMAVCSGESFGDGQQTVRITQPEMTKMTEEQSFALLMDKSAKWETATLGSWKCSASSTNLDSMLICQKGDRIVFVGSDLSTGFSVAVPLTAEKKLQNGKSSFLTLVDHKNGGVFDKLEYDGISKQGDVIRHVVDENLDGFIDLERDAQKGTTSVLIDGAWVQLEYGGRDENGLVIYKANIGGSMKRVIFKTYPYQVVDLPVQQRVPPSSTKDGKP